MRKKRIVTWFAWLPVRVKKRGEWRWLREVTVKQRRWFDPNWDGSICSWYWKNVKFVDKKRSKPITNPKLKGSR